MNEVFIKRMIKRFFPDIKEKAVPIIKDLLSKLFIEYGKQLKEGEESVNVVIQQQGEIIYYVICTMDKDNRVIRSLVAFTTEELIEKGFTLAKNYGVL